MIVQSLFNEWGPSLGVVHHGNFHQFGIVA
jgi:hypothetical protein